MKSAALVVAGLLLLTAAYFATFPNAQRLWMDTSVGEWTRLVSDVPAANEPIRPESQAKLDLFKVSPAEAGLALARGLALLAGAVICLGFAVHCARQPKPEGK